MCNLGAVLLTHIFLFLKYRKEYLHYRVVLVIRNKDPAVKGFLYSYSLLSEALLNIVYQQFSPTLHASMSFKRSLLMIIFTA